LSAILVNNADLALLIGDLNTEEKEVGYRILRSRAQLLDAYKEAESSDPCGVTCHSPTNVYGQPNDSIRNTFPNGIRIDYILYKANRERNVDVKCLAYKNCLGRVEGSLLNYSDHEGIYTEFKITKDAADVKTRNEIKHVETTSHDDLKMALSIIQRKYESLNVTYFKLFVVLALSLLLFFMCNEFHIIYLVMLKNFVSLFVFTLAFIYLGYLKPWERKSLYNMTCTLRKFLLESK